MTHFGRKHENLNYRWQIKLLHDAKFELILESNVNGYSYALNLLCGEHGLLGLVKLLLGDLTTPDYNLRWTLCLFTAISSAIASAGCLNATSDQNELPSSSSFLSLQTSWLLASIFVPTRLPMSVEGFVPYGPAQGVIFGNVLNVDS